MAFGAGLKDVATDDLRRVLARLHDGSLVAPVTQATLVTAGLHALIDRLGHLQGLDARSAQAVIVAVLAERGAPQGRS